MHRKNKEILFISPNASRSGAPILLLNFIKQLDQNSYNVRLVLNEGGDILDDYKAVCSTTVLLKYKDRGNFFVRKLIKTANLINKIRSINRIKRSKIDILYANTATVGDIALQLISDKTKIITHVHELKIQLKGSNPSSLLNRSKTIIAVSEEVKYFLIQTYNIPEGKINVIYGAPLFLSNHMEIPENHKQWLKGSFIVGAAGLADLRKGIDLFIQLCKITNEMSAQPIKFVWVGNNSEAYFNMLYNFFWEDIIKLNIQDKFLMTGQVANPDKYFCYFDVFCLTSREDPFPLVCLEAAQNKTPVICFDKGTGMKEFVSNNAGFVVPYLDVNSMAKKIIELSENKDLRENLGKNASLLVSKEHNFNEMSKQLAMTIDTTLGIA